MTGTVQFFVDALPLVLLSGLITVVGGCLLGLFGLIEDFPYRIVRIERIAPDPAPELEDE